MKMCLKLAYCAFSSSPSKDSTISIFWGFSSLFLLKYKPFDDFSSFQDVIANLFLSVATEYVCVCLHPLNKDVFQAIIAFFFSAFFKRW